MPTVARKTFLNRIRKEGMIEQIQRDFRLACRARVDFVEESPEDEGRVVPLKIGAVRLGYFVIAASDEGPRAEAVEHLLRAVAEQTAHRLARDHGDAPEGALPGTVARGAAFLRENFREEVSLNEVAKVVGLSPERFSRLFRSSLGLTFTEYRNQLRLDECRRKLLEGSDPITRIALEAGFQSLSQFHRCFRRAEGITPREYRRRK